MILVDLHICFSTRIGRRYAGVLSYGICAVGSLVVGILQYAGMGTSVCWLKQKQTVFKSVFVARLIMTVKAGSVFSHSRFLLKMTMCVSMTTHLSCHNHGGITWSYEY